MATFLCDFTRSAPLTFSPRRLRTTTTDGALLLHGVSRLFNAPSTDRIHEGTADFTWGGLGKSTLTCSSEPVQNPILMLVLTASKVCNHFRHLLSRPTHHVRNDRHCSHHDHSRYMLRWKPTLIAESPSPTLDLIVAIQTWTFVDSFL